MAYPLQRGAADVAINGRFLSQPTTGVQRYAREIVQGIDRLLSKRTGLTTPKLELLVPPDSEVAEYQLHNIDIRRIGRRRVSAWEQYDLPWSARDRLLLSLANSGPILHRRQIVAIHDAAVQAVPQYYTWKFRIWYSLLHHWMTRHSCRIISVSKFSVTQLERYYGITPGTISVVSNAANHIFEVAPDDDVLARHGLLPGHYIFAFGSHDPSKNAALVEQALELLPEPRPTLVVAGRMNPAIFTTVEAQPHVTRINVGAIADDELKALYGNAMCFVLPSFYEGFGIPALEAMACGCPVIVAHTSSLPEVCGDAALYCDPKSPFDLARQIRTLQSDQARCGELSRRGRLRAHEFSWDDSAARMLSLIYEELGKGAAGKSEGRLAKVGAAKA